MKDAIEMNMRSARQAKFMVGFAQDKGIPKSSIKQSFQDGRTIVYDSRYSGKFDGLLKMARENLDVLQRQDDRMRESQAKKLESESEEGK